jgi:hypothetical protein
MSTDNQAKVGMKYRKLTSSAKRRVIHSRKRMYDYNRIASATGYSPEYVGHVVRGTYLNDRILNFAYNMIRGRKLNSNIEK